MTPGEYLRRCREVAGLSIADVALRTETTPAISAHAREEIIRAIEADVIRLTVVDAAQLRPIYEFDWDEMARCEAPQSQIDRQVLTLRRAA